MDFKRLEGENERQYIWRTSKAVDNGELSWKEFADKVNYEWRADESEYRDESAYRKPLQGAKAYYEDVFSKMISNEYSDEIASTKRELERAKIQYRDERRAWNRQNYTAARTEQKLDYLEQIIEENGKKKFDIVYSPICKYGSKTMVVCLSDLHIGANYDSMWGKYNSDIAKERLQEYLVEAVEIGKRHDINEVVVVGIGDLLHGSIHKSIAITNRENVIEQIMLASEMITEFIAELCNYFTVNFINISGNHSRIDRKEDALKDERLDKLIGWYVQKSLSHISNFKYLDSDDTTLGVMYINDLPYWCIHGDYDNFSKTGLSNLVLAMGYKPVAVFTGHMHSAAMDDIADVKFIRSGSFGGSGDDYTVEKRLTGQPSQTIAICGSEGVECIYPVRLH